MARPILFACMFYRMALREGMSGWTGKMSSSSRHPGSKSKHDQIALGGMSIDKADAAAPLQCRCHVEATIA